MASEVNSLHDSATLSFSLQLKLSGTVFADSRGLFASVSDDHPGLVLVSQPLQEDNYASWCRSMRLVLSGKRKIGFIDGSLQKPDPTIHPVLAESLQCINDIVTTWLLNSISKDIAASVIYAGSAAVFWQDLETHFSQSNAPRIFELKRSLISLTQGSFSISQYFTKLKILWEEPNTFKPLVSCSCGGVKSIQTYLDQEYVILLLMGLMKIWQMLEAKSCYQIPSLQLAKFSLWSCKKRNEGHLLLLNLAITWHSQSSSL
ncbi:uncharacterized protein LOC107474510 [Arachis duranensis]|uniref:Uncharacterized protein LOC107474510 n=1 Tax=Arachis duranensis TaxID=130453 RepID=A0A6P4CE85_ARADU|nr:uncharacterized protein LOC107474510 [Arachis duranensis]QHO48364.1 uncharacterized protein DS421_1g04840 [Arachis hypogaea]